MRQESLSFYINLTGASVTLAFHKDSRLSLEPAGESGIRNQKIPNFVFTPNPAFFSFQIPD
jgi:hypothetical protein